MSRGAITSGIVLSLLITLRVRCVLLPRLYSQKQALRQHHEQVSKLCGPLFAAAPSDRPARLVPLSRCCM